MVTCRWCGQLFAAVVDLRWHQRHDHHLEPPAADEDFLRVEVDASAEEVVDRVLADL